MSHNVKIGIVTAAGYTEAEKYYCRLHGLLESIRESTVLSLSQKENIVIMGDLSIRTLPSSLPHRASADCIQVVNPTFSSNTTPPLHLCLLTFPDAAGSFLACPLGRSLPSRVCSILQKHHSVSAWPIFPCLQPYYARNEQSGLYPPCQVTDFRESRSRKPCLSSKRNSR